MKPIFYFISSLFLLLPIVINGQTELVDSLKTTPVNNDSLSSEISLLKNGNPSPLLIQPNPISLLDSIRFLDTLNLIREQWQTYPRYEEYKEYPNVNPMLTIATQVEGTLEWGLRQIVLPKQIRKYYGFDAPSQYFTIAGGFNRFNFEFTYSSGTGEILEPLEVDYFVFEKGTKFYTELIDLGISYRIWQKNRFAYTAAFLFGGGDIIVNPKIRRGTVVEERLPFYLSYTDMLSLSLGTYFDFRLFKESSNIQILLRAKHNVRTLLRQQGFLHDFSIGAAFWFTFEN